MIELRSIPLENQQKLRVIVVGGSLGGLCAALAMRYIGCDVEVFEKSPQEMTDRGAGLVMQPELIHFLEDYGIASREEVSVPSPIRQFLGRDGTVLGQQSSYQLMTSWGAVYRRLKAAFPYERYHHDCKLVHFERTPEQVQVCLANGREEVCDLLVCADGANSTCRHLLLPDVVPHYAGYVAWRGVINETQISPEVAEILADKFTFFNFPSTQMLCYLIPGATGENERGKRRFNWVWYWQVREGEELRDVLTDRTGLFRDYSIPQGSIRLELVKQQWAIAQKILPEVFQYLFAQTKEPFIQPIYDLSVPKMAFDCVCLLGDAAFVPRPHTAASTAKAAEDAMKLAKFLQIHQGNILKALTAWEKPQLEVGYYLQSLGIHLGSSLFQ